MPIGDRTHEVSRPLLAPEIKSRIEQMGELVPIANTVSDGPARRYRLKGAVGEIGFISALSHHFCDSCNPVAHDGQRPPAALPAIRCRRGYQGALEKGGLRRRTGRYLHQSRGLQALRAPSGLPGIQNAKCPHADVMHRRLTRGRGKKEARTAGVDNGGCPPRRRFCDPGLSTGYEPPGDRGETRNFRSAQVHGSGSHRFEGPYQFSGGESRQFRRKPFFRISPPTDRFSRALPTHTKEVKWYPPITRKSMNSFPLRPT